MSVWIAFFLFASSLQAYQDCKFKILKDPIRKRIKAREISSAGDDVVSDGGSASGGSFSGYTLTLDGAVDISNVSLNLSPEYIKKKVWRCNFKRRIHKNRLVVKYTLTAANGQHGGISNGSAFIPVRVETDRLYIRSRRKKVKVKGNVKFIFDLSSSQATRPGNYTGVLNIEVYEQ
jgi:hypothetical protein